MPNRLLRITSQLTGLLLLLAIRQSQARANVTMHLVLTYDSSENCDDTPYKVTVCVGHKHDKCRIFRTQPFYVQAACASHGPKEVIQFEVDNVREPLRVDATIKAQNSGKEYQLQPVTANLTFPRPIDAKTKNLNIILQFRFTYTCVSDYFGYLCEVFCSSEAKEYRCTVMGEKICNPGYVKDNVTGACIYDRCGSMPNYCLNGGKCVNKAQDEEEVGDSTTMPICNCPPTRMGPRCEIFRPPPETTTTTSTTTTTTPAPSTTTTNSTTGSSFLPVAMANSNASNENPLSGWHSSNKTSHPRLTLSDMSAIRASGPLEQPNPEREIWYQVVIFTVVAVCLTIMAFGICIAAGCYVVRLKAKAALLRRHQATPFEEMQFVDGGCLASPSVVGTGTFATAGLSESVTGGSGVNGNNFPVYVQSYSTMDYHTLQRPPSVRSFAMSRPQTTITGVSENGASPLDQTFCFSHGFNPQHQSSDSVAWPPLYRSPVKTFGDFGFDTFSRQAPVTTSGNASLEMGVTGDTLPTLNSPEAYTYRHDTYGYLSELHNHLGDTMQTSTPMMNNMLTLRAPTMLNQHVAPPKSPLEMDSTTNGTSTTASMAEMRKNDFQMTPTTPPREFADLEIK